MSAGYDDLTIPGDALREGGYTNGERQVTITEFERTSLSFRSDDRFAAIIVEGERRANLYRFPDGTSQEADLRAPGGTRIVRISFCY